MRPSESGRMILMIGNICSFVSSICLNVISLLITLALQRSLQATINNCQKNLLLHLQVYIYSTVQTFSFRCSKHTQTQPYSQTMHIVFQRKYVLPVFAILVEDASIYCHPNQKHARVSLPRICNQQYTIHWLMLSHGLPWCDVP